MDNDSDMTATLVKVKLGSPALFLRIVADISLQNYFSNALFVFQVDSANKYGTLLEVVQVLTDLKLTIKRAYISSDGEWFMDGE